MISAQEARKLGSKTRTDLIAKIEEKIRNAVENGLDYITLPDLGAHETEIIAELRRNNYDIVYPTQLDHMNTIFVKW